MRPIASCINCPNGPIAEYLTDILTRAYDTNNEFYVKDSFQFSKFINNFQLPNNYVIVSFDVVSLFTNLSLESVLKSIQNHWDTISQHCNLSFELFEELLTFIFDSNFSIFNNTYYKQILGTPMGSKISPILVNYVLDDLVRDCLDYMPFYIPFVKRYVDDLLLSVPKDRYTTALELFNSYDRYVQFTVEEETNNSIPFLDMLVLRNNDNMLQTKWYRKPYCSNRFISYHSYHPLRTKINLILGMKNRAVKLTHPQFRDTSLKQLKSILLDNSYPMHLINKFLFSTQYKIPENIPPVNSQPVTLTSQTIIEPQPSLQSQNRANAQQLFYFSLPYIEHLTDRLAPLFKDLNIKIAKRQVKPLSSIFTKTKTPLTKDEAYDVVYKIPCQDCELSYIGQTSRNLKSRLTSHKSDCRRGIKSCALAEHFIDRDHQIDWGNTEILENVNSYQKRLFLEMFHINLNQHGMNKKSDTDNLSVIYSYIIHVHNKNRNEMLDYPAPDE